MVVKELVALLGFKTDSKSVKRAEDTISGLVKGARTTANAFSRIRLPSFEAAKKGVSATFGFLADKAKRAAAVFKRIKFPTFRSEKKESVSAVDSLVANAKLAATAFASLKVVGVFKGIVEETAALGDKFDKMAQRTGIAADELQRWGYVANLSGASVDAISMGVRKLSLTIDMASKGSKEAADGFKALGVNVRKADGSLKTANDLLPELADGIAKLPNDTQRAAAAQRVLGESGVALLPLLKQGSAAIEAQRGELDALGGVLDDELIGLSTQFVDNQTRVAGGLQGVRNVIAKSVLPSFISMQESFVDLIKSNQGWIKTNIGGVFKRVGEAVATLSRFVADVSSAFYNWASALGPLEKGLLGISLVAAGLAAILLLPGGSILLLIGLIALIIEDFQRWREGGKSAIGGLITSLGELGDSFLAFLSSVIGSFPALSAALSIVWDQFKKTFDSITDIISSTWVFFYELFTQGIPTAFANLADNLYNDFGKLWDNIGGSLKDAVSGWLDLLGDFAISALEHLISPYKSAVDYISGLFGGDKGEKVATTARGLGSVASAGPGAMSTPMASAASSRSNTFVNPQTTVGINVTASAGMSEERLAQAVARQVETAIENQNRMTIQALSPAAAVGG